MKHYAIIMLTAIAAIARGQELVSYQFIQGQAGPTRAASGIIASNVTDPKMPRPDKQLPDYIGISKNGQAFWDVVFLKTAIEGADGAIAGEQYIEFTVGPAEGKTLNLKSVEFDYGASIMPDNTLNATVALTSSLDGHRAVLYRTSFDGQVVRDPSQWKPAGTAAASLDTSLFNALTQPVTFRLYACVNTAYWSTHQRPWSKQHVRVTNIRVNGDVQ